MATHSSILAGKSHGRKSLVGYSPWSCFKSQTWLSNQTTKGASQNFFFFWPRHAAYGIIVLRPGTEPRPATVTAWSPTHWTTREFPASQNFRTGSLSAPVSPVLPFHQTTTSSFTMFPPFLFKQWKHSQYTGSNSGSAAQAKLIRKCGKSAWRTGMLPLSSLERSLPPGLEPKRQRLTILWGETHSLVTESSGPHHLRGQHKPKEVAFVWVGRWGAEGSFRISKSGQRNAKPGCPTGGHPGGQLLPAETWISSCLELPWWSGCGLDPRSRS